MIQHRSKILWCSLFLTIASCGQVPSHSNLSPVLDEAEAGYTFRHKTEIVRGTFWSFERSGEPVVFGGPVGLNIHSFTYIVEVEPRVIDLSDMTAAGRPDPSDVAALIAAADQFCEDTGYRRLSMSASIQSTENSNLLRRHCVPPGVDIPMDAKAGDDIQRDPDLRAMGVPPLRGRDFTNRYGVERQ